MKIRTSFVSNSSTSSFVAIVEKQAHEEALKTLPTIYQELLMGTGFKEKDFCGVNCIASKGYGGGDGIYTINGFELPNREEWDCELNKQVENESLQDDDGNPLEGGWELYNAYQEALEKLPPEKCHIDGEDG